ncbi:MAG: hypothetical protein U5L45_21540 [Saprospiraceae bacterium]|nr:hypothetical protein [Saprospiraceae bacterium]
MVHFSALPKNEPYFFFCARKVCLRPEQSSGGRMVNSCKKILYIKTQYQKQ